MRVFLGTNVLVSAFATRGLCADLLELVLLEHDLVLGRQVLRELDRALRSKLRLSPARTREIAEFISGRAALFVTGDAEPLKLREIGSMPIVSPRGFWEILHAPGA